MIKEITLSCFRPKPKFIQRVTIGVSKIFKPSFSKTVIDVEAFLFILISGFFTTAMASQYLTSNDMEQIAPSTADYRLYYGK